MGGIGKTSIAVEFAFSRGDHFDAVFWVNAATLPKLEHSFAEIAVKLGLVDTWESSDHVILRELVKGWLENPQKPVIDDNHAMIQVEAHWLLIFDGADQPEILHDYWPLPSTGSILTTSRDPLSKSIKRYTAVGIDLLSLEDEESAALLWRLCPENDGHIRADAILSLARMSGGIPLMICRMAGFIRHHKLTFAYYLSRCRINPGLLDRLSDGVGASTWSTVMEELEPKPRALLEICAVLGANKIEERIFTSSIPDKDILSGLLLSKSTYISARSTVLRTSLIQHNSNSDEIYVHPIIQGLVWSKISLNRKSVVLSATILLIFRTWEPTSIYQRHMDLTPEDRSQLVPHVIQLERLVQGMNVNLGAPRRIPVAAESGLRSTSPFIKPPGPETPATEGIEFAKLMVDAIWFSETEPLVARAMCLSESRSDKEFLEIYFDTLYLWTDIINKTNRVTPAPDLQWHLLETALKISGHTSFGIFLAARAYNQVGIALCLTDKFANGIKKFIISIEKHDEATPKPEGGIDIEPKVNMALAYWRLGDLARAEEILQGTIDNFDNWEARYGTMNGYFQGRILHAWGNFYHHQGRFNVSAGLHERALQQYEAKFGKDHHKTADMCHKVAQHYILRAEYERARMLIDQGLGIWQREERFHQPELARTTYLKAILAEKCGNKEEAARLTKTAREMRNRVPHATVKTDKEPLTEGDFDEIVAFFAR
ncbi:MAG: hypothetical protein L6R42_009723 [Xanthoria sp. 1 TBL-2021]|nr:MAG: hypothetical protein L6R42_009723 [Xanthoria sp. 1 TBL-2021]